MNKRLVFQLLIILLLILLLAFYGGSKLMEGPLVREGDGTLSSKMTTASLSQEEVSPEEPIEKSKSPTEQPKPILRPISHSGWVKDGAYEVFGEIENEGVATARGIKAKIILKDGAWRRIGTAEAFIDNSTLAPGQKSAFSVLFRGVDSNRVGSYILLTEASQ